MIGEQVNKASKTLLDPNNESGLYMLFIYLYSPLSSVVKFYGDLCNWRASEASETLSGVYKFELVRYVYICIDRL